MKMVFKMSEINQGNPGSFASAVVKQSYGGVPVQAPNQELSTTVPLDEIKQDNNVSSEIDETLKHLNYKLEQVRISNPGSHDEIDILARLSRYYTSIEKYIASMDCLADALICAKQLYGKEHPVVAELLVESAFVAFKIESYDNALEFLTPAVEIYEGAYGKVSDQVASAFHKLGRVYEAVDQLDQAESYYQKSETTYRNSFNEDDSEVYVVRNDLARVRAKK